MSLPDGLALTDAMCCTSQWPAMSFSFSHAGAANNLVTATSRYHQRSQIIQDTTELFFPARDYIPVHVT